MGSKAPSAGSTPVSTPDQASMGQRQGLLWAGQERAHGLSPRSGCHRRRVCQVAGRAPSRDLRPLRALVALFARRGPCGVVDGGRRCRLALSSVSQDLACAPTVARAHPDAIALRPRHVDEPVKPAPDTIGALGVGHATALNPRHIKDLTHSPGELGSAKVAKPSTGGAGRQFMHRGSNCRRFIPPESCRTVGGLPTSSTIGEPGGTRVEWRHRLVWSMAPAC